MELGSITVKKLTFPGQAGQYQRGGFTPALIRELGDNYSYYHAFLRQELEKVAQRPDPDEYRARDDPEGYAQAWAWIQDIVKAEALLRNCRRYRRSGRRLSDALDPNEPPLVDEHDRLVSVE